MRTSSDFLSMTSSTFIAIIYPFIYVFCILFCFFPNNNLRLRRPAPHIRHTPSGDERKFGAMHIYNYFIAVNISLAGYYTSIHYSKMAWSPGVIVCTPACVYLCIFLWCFMPMPIAQAHCVLYFGGGVRRGTVDTSCRTTDFARQKCLNNIILLLENINRCTTNFSMPPFSLRCRNRWAAFPLPDLQCQQIIFLSVWSRMRNAVMPSPIVWVCVLEAGVLAHM